MICGVVDKVNDVSCFGTRVMPASSSQVDIFLVVTTHL